MSADNSGNPPATPSGQVVITAELARRPSRSPDYEAENRALIALAQELAASPATVLQKLSERVIDLCGGSSAGVSIAEGSILRWPAIAGPFAANVGYTMPLDASPCGVVLETDAIVLMNRADRLYPAMRGLEPATYEILLAPFYLHGKPVGTVWVIAHDPERRFDAEDARLLGSLSRFASAAYQMIAALDQAETARRDLERRIAERARTEEALRESEERFRLIVEGALDYGIFTADAEGRIETWSPGAAAVYGWPAEEAIGQPTAILFVPEDRAKGEHEKELAEAREKSVAPDVRWHLRKDGSRVFIEGVTRGLRNSSGALRGFFKIGQDVTERKRAEAALQESEERFRTLATHIPQLVFRSLGTGERTWGSPQWEAFTGLSDARSRGLGWLDAIHPDDREATMKAWREAEARGEYYAEHRVCCVGGDYRWHQTRAAPLRDETGRIIEWLGTSADIHDLRQLQERQSVLVAELQHRTRNLLAVVQAVMLQTLETSDSLDDFGRRFADRLAALGRAQGLLARGDGHAVTLGDLVRLELAAHGAEPNGERMSLDGPAVELPRRTVQTLALAVHELATNAVKYGALSTPSGRLSVSWAVGNESGGSGRRLVLDWRENGVLTLAGRAEPRRRGYGRELIEEALPYELDAATRLDFTEEGVRCEIELPLE